MKLHQLVLLLGRSPSRAGWRIFHRATDQHASTCRDRLRGYYYPLAIALSLSMCSSGFGADTPGGSYRPDHRAPTDNAGAFTHPGGGLLTNRGAAAADLNGTSPGGATATATFRVVETTGGVDNRWVITGSGGRISLGEPVLWDPMGIVTGYKVGPGAGTTTVASDTWYRRQSMIIPYQSQSTYAVALYANNSNPPLRPDPSGMITPGYVPDLAAYHAGTGPGWVAVDSSTGNALLLSVESTVLGSPVVTDQYGDTTGYTLLSPLGARTTQGIVRDLGPHDYAFSSSFPGQIPSNNPLVAFGCNVPYPAVSPNSTCRGGNLLVAITPVAVVRGDVVGVRTSTTTGSATKQGAWSPSGTYSLNLSGLVVFA